MIKEYNKNIVKCHNCSTLWTFNDEDVEEVGTSNQFGDNYKENESSSQLIRSVETMTIATVCGILEKDDIFPLKEIEFF